MKTLEKMCYLLASANVLRNLFGPIGNWMTEYNQFGRHHINMAEVMKSVIPLFFMAMPVAYMVFAMIYLGLH